MSAFFWVKNKLIKVLSYLILFHWNFFLKYNLILTQIFADKSLKIKKDTGKDETQVRDEYRSKFEKLKNEYPGYPFDISIVDSLPISDMKRNFNKYQRLAIRHEIKERENILS